MVSSSYTRPQRSALTQWPRRSARRGAGLFGVTPVLLLALLVGLGVYAFPRLGVFLLVSDEPAPADATFLTYGVSIRRVALDEAIRRYKNGEAPRVLLGALLSRNADYYVVPHSSALARQYLLDGGVSPEAIEVLPSVSNELEEAEQLRQALSGRSWTRVIAYAADFRVRRTMGTLKRTAASSGVEVRVVAVRDSEVQLERWWENSSGINAIWNEYPRLAYYFFTGRL